MSTIALRRTNINTILWEPVPSTGQPFTSTESPSSIHAISGSFQLAGIIPIGAKLVGNSIADPSLAHHNVMVEMAQKFEPDDLWFDEDFTNVRHPGR